jgi:hypothetical protein
VNFHFDKELSARFPGSIYPFIKRSETYDDMEAVVEQEFENPDNTEERERLRKGGVIISNQIRNGKFGYIFRLASSFNFLNNI